MSRTQPVELVTMVLVRDPQTKQVLVEDKINVPWKAGHSFPGGHVEVGESGLSAAIREVREETGLVLTTAEFCGTCEWFDVAGGRRKLGLLYQSDQFTGELHASAEGRVYWLPENELTVENSAESLLTLLRVFHRETAAVVSEQWDGELHEDTGTTRY